jgi:prolyl 4-hydroxylase
MLRIISLTLIMASVQGADYGVDCSFPIHNEKITCDKSILGDRQAFYDNYIAGCVKKYGKKGHRCLDTEADRVIMSKRQPQSMVNYTDTGFKKIKAPKAVMDLLKRHWDLNKADAKEEVWPAGNTYVNHWETPTKMVSVEDKTLRGGGHELKNAVWDAAKSTIEAWTGMEQTPTSMYGIRIYGEGAVLNPHVDRLPLVSSCIINVDQDVDEDWVLEVYDRHDRAVNVTVSCLPWSLTFLHVDRSSKLSLFCAASLFCRWSPVTWYYTSLVR